MFERFDIEAHADNAARSFDGIRKRYESLAEQTYRIFDQSFMDSKQIRIHDIEHRAKKVDSFRKKCLKQDKNGNPKYNDPMNQITDLAGVRVILFFPDDVKIMCRFVEEHFEIVEKQDVGEARYAASGSFGYQSIHFLVKLHPDRLKMPDFVHFGDMICEVQVRTILQHAWAEMEHDIQYKSPQSLPAEIKRKFMALAGMLEIADREFQSIQYEDNKLRASIKKSLEEQLTKESLSSVDSGPSLKTEGLETKPDDEPSNSFRARDLVIAGDYSRAVEVYTRQIASQPAAHTLYLGRAKARFLAGDRDGALEDIASAQALKADDPAVSIARGQIESGNVQRPTFNSERATGALKNANDALGQGDGETAFEFFSEAQSAGHNYAFSLFNMAMSCVLARDTVGARRLLAELKPVTGTPMSINILGLILIAEILENPVHQVSVQNFIEKRSAMSEFSFDLSPMRNLEKGLSIKETNLPAQIASIFAVMKNDRSEERSST